LDQQTGLGDRPTATLNSTRKCLTLLDTFRFDIPKRERQLKGHSSEHMALPFSYV
jgi:hypothetical protein